MSNLSFLKIATWVPDQVANWLKGLDDVLQPYVPRFVSAGVTGQRLLSLDPSDLERLGVEKLGHRDLILEAVHLLSSLHYDLEFENLQSLALQLSVCASSVRSEVKSFICDRLVISNINVSLRAQLAFNNQLQLPVGVLGSVSEAAGLTKRLVSWLDRSPFSGSGGYIRTRNAFVKLAIDLVGSVQGQSDTYEEDVLLNTCLEICKLCETLIIDSKDSLVIQPASLQLATVRRKPGEELGMHIQSTYVGTHMIGGVKLDTPADCCGKIDPGDEVIQVNYQTVVGWRLPKLLEALREHPKDVTLMLKKRPHHLRLHPLANHRRRASRKQGGGGGGGGSSGGQWKGSRRSRKPSKKNSTDRSSSGAAAGDRASCGAEDRSSGLPELLPPQPFCTEVLKEADSDPEADVFGSAASSTATSASSRLGCESEPKQRRATVSGGSTLLSVSSLSSLTSLPPPVSRPRSCSIIVSSPSSESSQRSEPSPGGGLQPPTPLRYTFETGDVDKAAAAAAAATSSVRAPGHVAPGQITPGHTALSQVTPGHAAPGHAAPGHAVPGHAAPELVHTAEDSGMSHAAREKPGDDTSTARRSTDNVTPGFTATGPRSASQTAAPTAALRSTSVAVAARPKFLPAGPRSMSATAAPRSTSVVAAPRRMSAAALLNSISAAAAAAPRSASTTAAPRSTSATAAPRSTSLSLASADADGAGPVFSDDPPLVAAAAMAAAVGALDVRPSAVSGVRRSRINACAPLREDDREPSCTVQEEDKEDKEEEEDGETPGTPLVFLPSSPPPAAAANGKPPMPQRESPLRIVPAPRREGSTPPREGPAPHREIAGDVKSSPQLVRVRRIDSEARGRMNIKERRRESDGGDVSGAADRTAAQPISYMVNIVAGVAHKWPCDRDANEHNPPPPSPSMMLRRNLQRKLGGDRRISCKDLGCGDCQGWLWKRRDSAGLISSKWVKRWFVLKTQMLYYYKGPDEQRAQGIIHLPAFQVSPAAEIKSKKFAFKLHNSGTTFFFAAERQTDLSKWMNKMGLASISLDTRQSTAMAGFICPTPSTASSQDNTAFFSESEDELLDSDGLSAPVTPISSRGPSPVRYPRGCGAEQPASPVVMRPHSPVQQPQHAGTLPGADARTSSSSSSSSLTPERDDLHSVYCSIESADLGIDGVSVKVKRTSTLTSADQACARHSGELHLSRRICSLQRTLKDKLHQYEIIEAFLSHQVTVRLLREFLHEHAHIVDGVPHDELATYSTSDGD